MVGKVVTYILVCFSGSLTLATVLLMWPELVNGMVVGQQIWFQWLSMIFVGSVAFMWFFNKNKVDLVFTLPDFLVLLTICFYITIAPFLVLVASGLCF